VSIFENTPRELHLAHTALSALLLSASKASDAATALRVLKVTALRVTNGIFSTESFLLKYSLLTDYFLLEYHC
jgi:hypothetical protein